MEKEQQNDKKTKGKNWKTVGISKDGYILLKTISRKLKISISEINSLLVMNLPEDYLLKIVNRVLNKRIVEDKKDINHSESIAKRIKAKQKELRCLSKENIIEKHIKKANR